MMRIRVSKYVKDRIGRQKDDFIIQTFCAGGKGGMNQNSVLSGVRIIDKETGLRSECREERDQLQNKKKAFLKLIDLLVSHYAKEEHDLCEKEFNDKVVRTYDKKRNVVEDHRLDAAFDYNSILDGKIDKLIEAIRLTDVGE